MEDVGGALKGEDGVVTAAFDSSANKDGSLRYVTDLILRRVHSLIFELQPLFGRQVMA